MLSQPITHVNVTYKLDHPRTLCSTCCCQWPFWSFGMTTALMAMHSCYSKGSRCKIKKYFFIQICMGCLFLRESTLGSRGDWWIKWGFFTSNQGMMKHEGRAPVGEVGLHPLGFRACPFFSYPFALNLTYLPSFLRSMWRGMGSR